MTVSEKHLVLYETAQQTTSLVTNNRCDQHRQNRFKSDQCERNVSWSCKLASMWNPIYKVLIMGIGRAAEPHFIYFFLPSYT